MLVCTRDKFTSKVTPGKMVVITNVNAQTLAMECIDVPKGELSSAE